MRVESTATHQIANQAKEMVEQPCFSLSPLNRCDIQRIAAIVNKDAKIRDGEVAERAPKVEDTESGMAKMIQETGLLGANSENRIFELGKRKAWAKSKSDGKEVKESTDVEKAVEKKPGNTQGGEQAKRKTEER